LLLSTTGDKARASVAKGFICILNGKEVDIGAPLQGEVKVMEKIVIDGWVENLHTSQEFRASFPNSRFSSPQRQNIVLTSELLDFTTGGNLPVNSTDVVAFGISAQPDIRRVN
jgi:hypothetical protein